MSFLAKMQAYALKVGKKMASFLQASLLFVTAGCQKCAPDRHSEGNS